MDDTIVKIALAAFMHDIGKFADKDALGISLDELDDYDLQLYLPQYKGRYSHYHAVFTAEFIARFKNSVGISGKSS